MMVNSKIKKKKVTLVTKFAIIIGISIFYSVFFISAYNIYASLPIIEQYKLDKTIELNSISNFVYTEFQDTYLEEKRDQRFRTRITNLIKNKLILHVGVIDKSTNKYEWSSIRKFEGMKTSIQHPMLNVEFKKYFNIEEKNLSLKQFNIDDKVLVITFFHDKAFLTLVEILKNGNFMLGITFILFGFLSASLLARQITKPIEQLIVGVWEFSKGNLDYRTPIETYDEIGILAKAFNYMAEKLKELYTSLEHKVKERTLELSNKNEELNEAYKELKDAQSLLVHNEKMRSLGELVAGVAHELNNPINFIYGNMFHLNDYSENLIKIISMYEEIEQTSENGKFKEIKNLKKEIDYDFLKDDIKEIIKSCSEGSERSKQIILELKNFSRLDQGDIKEINVNESIDSTLNILMNKYRDKVVIYKEYSDLPMLNCYAGQLNQVFMNILDNAVQAIHGKGDVYIKTYSENNNIVIEFKDTGEGIEQEILPKIFDPFFTTKPVGTGSGMGLSISYKIIKTHNGTIDIKSEKGKGTTFTLKIPLNSEEEIKNKIKNEEVEVNK